MNISEVAVSQAARLFGTDISRLYLLGGMDGLAYTFERDSQGYVLKVAPLPADHPEHMPRMAEKSDFVAYLADNGVRFARPVHSINGNWVERIDSAEGSYVASAAVRALGYHVNGCNPAKASTPLFLKHHQILLYIVFATEWGKKLNSWQANTLKNWRHSIINDLPGIDFL